MRSGLYRVKRALLEFAWLKPFILLPAAAIITACTTMPRPGASTTRTGDEIVVAGQFFHSGTPVVLWMDPGGYDAYRVERRFGPIEKADWADSTAEVEQLRSPNRYSLRREGLTEAQIEKVRGGGWDVP